MKAMILAAGLGTRLRPLTEHLPKPLVPVLGRPLLEKIIEDLARAGAEHIIINTHHLAGQIEEFVKRRFPSGKSADGKCPRISLSHEPDILGTGGALVKVRDFLDTEDFFLLHNGDVLTDICLKDLISCHKGPARQVKGPDILATLGVADYEPENKILVSREGEVLDILGTLGAPPTPDSRPSRNIGKRQSLPNGKDSRILTYTGIAVLSPRIFDYLPRRGYASIIDALIKALADHPGCVRAPGPEGPMPGKFYWNDLGSLSKYLGAHRDILVNRLLNLKSSPLRSHPPFSVWPGSKISPKARLKGFVSIGPGCEIEDEASLEDSVVLENTVVRRGKSYVRAVIGKDFCVTEEFEGMEPGKILQLEIVQACGFGMATAAAPLVEQGSDRLFFRLSEKGRTAVLMVSPSGDPDFEHYVAIGKFLHNRGLGTPEIYGFDPEKKALIMEDLGDNTLYLLVRGEKDKRRLSSQYRKAIDLLVSIQTETQDSLADCPPVNERTFDYGQLRWETDYFAGNFLRMDMGLDETVISTLDQEFHSLADAVSKQPLVFMHRDFQSQNILIKNGEVRLVDFQGARKGSLAYDLVSLLKDAYVEIPADLRHELLEYYHRKLIGMRPGPALGMEELTRAFLLAGLQRNMQALGAFSFLSLVKGRRQFRKFIPLCFRHLREGLGELNDSRSPPGPFQRLAHICSELPGPAP